MNSNKKFLENLNLSNVSFCLLGLAIILSVFLTAGISYTSLAIVVPIIFLLVYFMYKNESLVQKLPKIVQILLAFFVLFSALSIIKSYDIHQSIVIFFWLIISIIAGIEASTLVKENGGLKKFSNILILSSTIVIASGLYLYFAFDDYANLRFISTFFQPNPLAGFLLLPISLLLPIFIFTTNLKKNIFLGFLSILTLGGFILTVSRGAMSIFILVWLFIFIISLLKKEYVLKTSHLIKIISIVFLAVILAVGIYKLKMSHASIKSNNNYGTNQQVFSGGATKDEAISSRFKFMKTGLTIVRDNLFLGIGLGAYREAEIKYRDNPIYETNDPHNLYLRIFSETGILGGISFLAIVALVGLFVLYKLWKMNLSKLSPIEIGLMSGTICIIFHNFMEADWYFPANMFLSIVAFFVLYSVFSSENDNFSATKSRYFRIISIIVVFIIMFFSILIFIGDNKGMQGPYFRNKQKNELAVDTFEKGLFFDKYNPLVLYNYSEYLFSQAENSENIQEKKDFLEKSLMLINRALFIKVHDSTFYALRADIYKAFENPLLYETNLKLAIENNKTLDLVSYLKLSQKYLEDKKYEEVIKITDEALNYYSTSVFKNTFWNNPDKGMLKFYTIILETNKISALKKLGRKEEAKKVSSSINSF